MKSCVVCSNEAKASVCSECLSVPPSFKHKHVVCLKPYSGQIKDLILRVKKEDSLEALEGLTQFFANHEDAKKFACWADALVPCPSSVWGRLKNRFDLAWFLSKSLSRKHSIPIENPSYSLFWSFEKRSFQRARAPLPMSEFSKFSRQNTQSRKVLIIDDVLTSGTTLIKTATHHGSHQFRFLTLAHAATFRGKVVTG